MGYGPRADIVILRTHGEGRRTHRRQYRTGRPSQSRRKNRRIPHVFLPRSADRPRY